MAVGFFCANDGAGVADGVIAGASVDEMSSPRTRAPSAFMFGEACYLDAPGLTSESEAIHPPGKGWSV